MSSTQQRSGHWDQWKGFAIIAVIAIHATSTTADQTHPAWAESFSIVFRQFVNPAVALFLAMAGYFAARSWRGDAIEYWRSRGLRILPPYLAWTLIALALLKPSHFLSPWELFKDFAFGTGIGIGYYVIVLLQYVLLVPVLARLHGKAVNVVVMLVISLVGLSVSYTLQNTYANASWARFPYYCIPFFLWAPFFHLGFWAARNADGVKPRSDGLWLWLAIAAMLAAVAEGFFWNSRNLYLLATSQIKATSFLAAVFVTLHVIATRTQLHHGSVASGLAWLGRSSYLIYLSHMIFLPKVTSLVRNAMPTLFEFRPMALLLATALTAAICIGLAALLRAATPAAIHRDLLGAG